MSSAKRDVIQEHPDLVQAYCTAIMQAIARMKQDKPYVLNCRWLSRPRAVDPVGRVPPHGHVS